MSMYSSTSSASATKRAKAIQEALQTRATPKTTQKVENKFAAIESNPYYKILFSEANPETKSAEVVKQITSATTKAEARQRIKEYEEFQEFLSDSRQELATQLIKLTDTETFSELQQLYGDLNRDFDQFNQTIKPLTDILDAVFTLRTKGATFDAYKDIMEEKKKQAEIEAEKEVQEKNIKELYNKINGIMQDIATKSEDKNFIGQIRKAAREEIARKNVDLTDLQSQLPALQTKIKELNEKEQSILSGGEFSAEKKQLRNLLDLTTDQHKERQKALVDMALNFIQNSKSRVGSVRNHFVQMSGQIENITDVNTQMNTIYSVLNDGITKAASDIRTKREKLVNAPENESNLDKMKRENERTDIDSYITNLDNTVRNTQMESAELTNQAIRLKSMKDATDSQIDKIRTLHTQGVAGVADRLGTVLTSISASALGESSAVAKNTLISMMNETNDILKKDVIKNATGIDEINQDVSRALDELGSFGEVMRTATSIQREGLSEMQQKINELKNLASDTSDALKEAHAVHAEMGQPKTNGQTKPETTANPFKLG